MKIKYKYLSKMRNCRLMTNLKRVNKFKFYHRVQNSYLKVRFTTSFETTTQS
jgi:hypothetical protein